LSTAPALQLPACRHAYHAECLRDAVRAGRPGPAVTFAHLACPQCGLGGSSWTAMAIEGRAPVSHPALRADLQDDVALLAEVARVATQRIAAYGPSAFPEVEPGGEWAGRPVDYALDKFNFYRCFRCGKAYYGGQRECGAAPPGAPAGWAAEELVCPGCCVTEGGRCSAHGADYIEWKCRFCCSVATWVCFGGVHMCTGCHDKYLQRGGWGTNWQPTPCAGPATCPLRTAHAPNGMEHCLGCALCRANR